MGERDDARREVEQRRERMSEIAHEVSRRMTPQYAKERAREMARDRMMRVKDSATESSWFAPLLGAGIGALVAKAVQSRAQDRYGYGERAWERDTTFRGDDAGYPYARDPYWTEPAGAPHGGEPFEARGAGSEGGRLSETGAKLSEKASEMKDRAQAATHEVRERLQGATSAVRERLPDREAIRKSTHEDLGIWAFGALALGALFGLALPISRREREVLEPARRKAMELGEQVKEKALEKGSSAMDQASARLEQVGGSQEAQPRTGAGAGETFPGSPTTPIH